MIKKKQYNEPLKLAFMFLQKPICDKIRTTTESTRRQLPKKFVVSMLELAAFNLDSDLKLSYVPLIASSIK